MKAKACRECRQQKLRCDYVADGCKRCRRRNVECIYDPKFKRVPKRPLNQKPLLADGAGAISMSPSANGNGYPHGYGDPRIQQQQHPMSGIPLLAAVSGVSSVTDIPTVTNGVGPQPPLSPRLRALTARSPATGLSSLSVILPPIVSGGGTNATNTPSALPSEGHHSAATVESSPPLKPPSSNLMTGVIPCLESVQIDGSTVLSPSEVTEFFNIFVKHQLYYLPLEISLNCDEVYRQSPLLFWTICTTAGRLHSQIAKMQAQTRLLASHCLMKPERSIEQVQALLILSTWPLPYGTQLEDQSGAYSALAALYAMQMGLHRPSLVEEYVYGNRPDISNSAPLKRLSTWMACYVVCQREGVRHGLPSVIQPDHTLIASMEDPRINARLRVLCKMTYNSAVMANVLGTSGDNTTGLMAPHPRFFVLKQFMQQLDSLGPQLAQYLHEPYMEINYLFMRLQVLSFACNSDMKGILEVMPYYGTAAQDASRLIRAVRALDVRYVPSMVVRGLLYASITLMTVLRMAPMVVPDKDLLTSDVELATQILTDIYNVNGGDAHILTMRNFIQMLPTVPWTNDSPHWILSRSAANIIYEWVSRTRRYQDQLADVNNAVATGMMNDAWFEELLNMTFM